MILSQAQISKIITENPNKDLINKAKTYNKELRCHIYGEGLESAIQEIKGFEQPSMKDLRAKYAQSNKDLMARLSRPIDKVFSARGGSVYYNMADAQNKTAMQLSSEVRSGYSSKKWIETFWKPHMLDDPNGIIFMEIAVAGSMAGRSYPTYKPITAIFDYLPNGSSLEYVVLTVSKGEKAAVGISEDQIIYRVVDDAFDYYVRNDGGVASILNQHTIRNYFGKVPAMLNSDIVSPQNDSLRLSFFDEILELASQFLLKGSIKITHEFMHGFPKYWEYADDCGTCRDELNGVPTGFVDGKVCPDCKGSKKNTMSKVSDVKLLDYPQDRDTPTITPNVAGYVEPSKIYYEIASSSLADLENLQSYTLWGVAGRPKAESPGVSGRNQEAVKTATQIMEELKPEAARLFPISEMAEKRDKFIRDHVIAVGINNPGYAGCSVNYGRRYVLETADEATERYINGKKNGLSEDLLDEMYVDVVELKYAADPIGMEIQLKLMDVHPFIHNTIAEVQKMGVPDEDYYSKLYYSQWLRTMNDAMLLSYSRELLKDSLMGYAREKVKQKPQPEVVKPVLN